QRPGIVTRGYRYGQIISGGLLALAHGTNDAQKTMGIITLALIANGSLGAESDPPFWVIASAAAAIGGLTYGFTRIFGTGALGPILVTLMALSLIAVAFVRRAERGAPVEA